MNRKRFMSAGVFHNAHRGKARKAGLSPLALRMSEEEIKPVLSKGWAVMIRTLFGYRLSRLLTSARGREVLF